MFSLRWGKNGPKIHFCHCWGEFSPVQTVGHFYFSAIFSHSQLSAPFERPQMWVWPQLPFPPPRQVDDPSLHAQPFFPPPTSLFPHTLLALFAMLGRGRPGLAWGRRRTGVEGGELSKRHLGPDPHFPRHHVSDRHFPKHLFRHFSCPGLRRFFRWPPGL